MAKFCAGVRDKKVQEAGQGNSEKKQKKNKNKWNMKEE